MDMVVDAKVKAMLQKMAEPIINQDTEEVLCTNVALMFSGRDLTWIFCPHVSPRRWTWLHIPFSPSAMASLTCMSGETLLHSQGSMYSPGLRWRTGPWGIQTALDIVGCYEHYSNVMFSERTHLMCLGCYVLLETFVTICSSLLILGVVIEPLTIVSLEWVFRRKLKPGE